MGLFSTLNVGVSGMNASSTSMDVIGDNIANVNTAGFKSSRVSFEDLLASRIGSAGQIGRGTRLGSITQNFGQGTFEASSNVTDLAINGQGFFIVRDPLDGGEMFTRAGQFYVDSDGNLVNSNGYILQGYDADANGVIGTALGDLQLNADILAPSASSTLSLVANLDSGTEVVEDPAKTLDISASSYTFDELNEISDFSTSVNVFDSLGETHEVTLYFQKSGDGEWNYIIASPADELQNPSGIAEGDNAAILGSGSLIFNEDGTLDTSASSVSSIEVQFAGAGSQSIELDLSDKGKITQYGQASALIALDQDGYGPGFMTSVDVGEDGVITGIFSNGEVLDIGQVALANFENLQGLERRGGNLLAATQESGEPVIGSAGSGSLGTLSSNTVELSNVDLESEFVKMISTQLSYQANSRVVSTVDAMLNQLLQII